MFQNLVFRCKDVKRQRRKASIEKLFPPTGEGAVQFCHCEGVKRPSQSQDCCNMNEITTQTAFARNDNNFFHTEGKEEIRSSRFTLHPSLKKRVAFTLAEGATHAANSHNIRRAAFTLAEVLITLGIIGVVAAMTIPSLINNYQKKQTVTKLKQTYSIISQALTMAQAEHGDSTTWELAGIYGTPTGDSNFSSKEALETFVKKYFVPYLKVSKDYGYTTRNAIKYDGPKLPTDGNLTSGANSYKYFLQLPSNVLISISIGTSGCSEGTSVADGTCVDKYLNPDFIVDINGFQGPNKLGKDVFVMTFNLHSRIFEFYKYESNKQSALKNCKSGTFYTCGYFILLDGWEIKEDYPW